jgi:hypothetical protein
MQFYQPSHQFMYTVPNFLTTLVLNTLNQIRIISYMLHVGDNFIFSAITCGTTFLLKSPPPKKKIPTHFHSQQCSCWQQLYIWINQRQLTFLDRVAMGLITDMQTYKSLSLVQHLFHNTLYCII